MVVKTNPPPQLKVTTSCTLTAEKSTLLGFPEIYMNGEENLPTTAHGQCNPIRPRYLKRATAPQKTHMWNMLEKVNCSFLYMSPLTGTPLKTPNQACTWCSHNKQQWQMRSVSHGGVISPLPKTNLKTLPCAVLLQEVAKNPLRDPLDLQNHAKEQSNKDTAEAF